MQNEKNLYDLSNEELKEKLNQDFIIKYSSVNYTTENWELMVSILDEFNKSILETGFPLALFNETRYKLSQVESLVKTKKADVIFDKIWGVVEKIGKFTKTVYDSIKFAFSIFALSFASVVLTMFIHLILGTFIYSILPNFVTPMILKTVIASILFIVFRVMTFLDMDDKDVFNDHKKQILKYCLTIPFYACVFLIFLLMNELPVLEEFIPFFYPHMWLSSFTGEYVYSPMISLLINSLIAIAIYLIIRKKEEY